MTQNSEGRSRLSYAQEHPEFANDNPLVGKAKPLTESFEHKRCPLHAKQLADADNGEDERRRKDIAAFKAKRRKQAQGSGMVRNHKPFPELKPSPVLAHRVKAQSHYQALAKERVTTQRINRIQTTTISKGDQTMDNTQNQNQQYQQSPQQHPDPQQSQQGQQQSQGQNAPAVGNKPETVIRDGSLKATVWSNVNKDGNTYYSTSLAKTYTDAQGNPRDTQNFSQSDLLRVSELAREAYGVINDLKRGQGVEQSQAPSQNQSNAQDREAFKQSRRQSNGQSMPEPSQGF